MLRLIRSRTTAGLLMALGLLVAVDVVSFEVLAGNLSTDPAMQSAHIWIASLSTLASVVIAAAGFWWLATFRGMAERKRMEDALRVSSRVIENADLLIAVVDRSYVYRSVNPTYSRMYGKTTAEIEGKPVARLLGEEAFHTLVRPNLDRCFAGESVYYDAWFNYPVAGRRYMAIRYYPLAGNGAVEYAVVMARDITYRKESEEALRESEARFRRLADNAQDVIFRLDLLPAPHFSYISPAIRTLVSSTDDHETIFDLAMASVHPEDRHIAEGILCGDVRPGPAVVRWSRKDGGTVWMDLRTVPVWDEAGRLVAVEGIARDITEHKLLEDQLLRAHRLETAGRVAGQVAHDFNNLLGPLTLYPELIKSELPEGHQAVEYCDVMIETAQHMAEINSDMMALARRARINYVPTALNRIIEDVVARIPDAPDSLTIELDLARDLLPVRGSAAQLLRVVSNLVLNAREAMGDSGRVVIRTENVYAEEAMGSFERVDVGEYVRLSVSDSGPGIPREIKDKVFEPFFTTKNASARRGSGLGLSIVQAIVADHQGRLDVETEVGAGTTFLVYLPISRDEVESEAVRALQGEGGGGEKLLVVDDDSGQRRVLGDVLSKLGYQVATAASGEEALSYLGRESVDLAILDMVMPGSIDGAETYRRALESRPGLRAILVSGFAESGSVQKALDLGAGRFVRKPVSMESLARAVREELDRKP